MRITIDISDAGAAVHAQAPTGSNVSQTTQPVGSLSVAPPDLLARATASGALDGGPAPSAAISASGSPHPLGGAPTSPRATSASAGPAPEYLFKAG